jgi:two-component system chemotaxis response regulator CheY
MSAAVRFLVVDDFSTMRRMVRSVLHDLGYDTDINMPGMAGIDLLKAVRADPQLSKLPVLLVTAEAKREQIVEAARAGVNGYVIKPFTPQVLKDKIEKILAAAGKA